MQPTPSLPQLGAFQETPGLSNTTSSNNSSNSSKSSSSSSSSRRESIPKVPILSVLSCVVLAVLLAVALKHLNSLKGQGADFWKSIKRKSEKEVSDAATEEGVFDMQANDMLPKHETEGSTVQGNQATNAAGKKTSRPNRIDGTVGQETAKVEDAAQEGQSVNSARGETSGSQNAGSNDRQRENSAAAVRPPREGLPLEALKSLLAFCCT
ncbi:hypothetical protein Emag_006422 [Eimeria magna]